MRASVQLTLDGMIRALQWERERWIETVLGKGKAPKSVRSKGKSAEERRGLLRRSNQKSGAAR